MSSCLLVFLTLSHKWCNDISQIDMGIQCHVPLWTIFLWWANGRYTRKVQNSLLVNNFILFSCLCFYYLVTIGENCNDICGKCKTNNISSPARICYNSENWYFHFPPYCPAFLRLSGKSWSTEKSVSVFCVNFISYIVEVYIILLVTSMFENKGTL